MAFGAFVQQNTTTGASGAATTPTLAAGATAGNLLILCVTRASTIGTPPTVTAPAMTQLTATAAGNLSAVWYYAIAAGTETTVTLANETNTAASFRCTLAEYEGPFAAVSPLDVTAEDETNLASIVTTCTSGTTATTAQNVALAIAYFCGDSASAVDGGGTRNYTNSFTENLWESTAVSNSRAGHALASLVTSTTGTYTTTYSVTDTGDEMYGAIAVFKADSGGSVTVPYNADRNTLIKAYLTELYSASAATATNDMVDRYLDAEGGDATAAFQQLIDEAETT
jgi:hypothetical protein